MHYLVSEYSNQGNSSFLLKIRIRVSDKGKISDKSKSSDKDRFLVRLRIRFLIQIRF